MLVIASQWQIVSRYLLYNSNQVRSFQIFRKSVSLDFLGVWLCWYSVCSNSASTRLGMKMISTWIFRGQLFQNCSNTKFAALNSRTFWSEGKTVDWASENVILHGFQNFVLRFINSDNDFIRLQDFHALRLNDGSGGVTSHFTRPPQQRFFSLFFFLSEINFWVVSCEAPLHRPRKWPKDFLTSSHSLLTANILHPTPSLGGFSPPTPRMEVRAVKSHSWFLSTGASGKQCQKLWVGGRPV